MCTQGSCVLSLLLEVKVTLALPQNIFQHFAEKDSVLVCEIYTARFLFVYADLFRNLRFVHTLRVFR